MTTKNKTTTPAEINVDAVYAGLGDYTESVLGNETETVTMLQILVDANVPETHLISPSRGKNKHLSTATPEFFEGLKAAIEARYPKEVHALMEMSSKAAGNTYVGPNNRTAWRNKANSIIGGMRTAYINRLKRQGDIESGKQGADTRNKTAEIKVSEALTNSIKWIQKADAFECSIELDDLIKGLGKLAKTIG